MGPEDLTGVLVTSICEKIPSSLASLLEANDAPVQHHPLLQAYPLHVKTKYFTADIHLFACKDPTDLSDDELSQFEALIVLFDANCDNFKENAEQLEQLRNRCKNSEINLAVCELCENEAIKRIFKERLSEFELIETEAEDQDECGIDRMKEALRMHTWSNLIMHDRERLPPNSRIPEHLITGGTVPLQESAGSSNPAEIPDDANPPVDPEADISFEEVFAKFASFKSRALTLEGDERRKFAEQVVTQFWKAMGQDDSELAGLDSDSE
ncbi:uncharacterized protein LOC100908145 [Galendromus occidentalis]|uniref:Uncharacterized protein LOC100908145 n=1 Tax=Galendromus occidentalis TaxID=34638 RepID=A0AAJ6W0J8_9ACAR|nr:uncharacterized protein LOC100908145 [Galendromus occidentalis]